MKTLLFILFSVLALPGLTAQSALNEVKGRVTDAVSGSPLVYCNVLVDGTHIATVTNNEGEFSLKLAGDDALLVFRFLGYMERKLSVRELEQSKGAVRMTQVAFQLPQIDVLTQDGSDLVRVMLERVEQNYPEQEMLMTAFYRESIRKGRTYVSLAEAVVDIQKQPYTSYKYDAARLYKARKQTDYTRLDTLVFKLMGGPYNSLYLDVMKNPQILFTDRVFDNYRFRFNKVEYMDQRMVYVVDFEHVQYTDEPLYAGKLYIDARNMALKSAVFSLDLTRRDDVVRLFIRKKPFNAEVTPIQADYRIDYIEKDGKWYYGYSRIELGMKINWKRKLFHTFYYSTLEMAVTDREQSSDNKAIRFRDRLRSDVIISDAADGFGDPGFWGPYNVIEPDKPIEAAIRKIRKEVEKN
ncbi:MAG: hypothetical protein BGP01_07135 [Paludibacter sp. 47-17]|jgi:hypothetical protein|nr:MAG: hypothetical protein ABS72_03225 [Paludibacter sp. SCN 50-10]OJX88054.1 MAG: hypothetical protein BGP01_07135 [Paludibacter sp. 47-17]